MTQNSLPRFVRTSSATVRAVCCRNSWRAIVPTRSEPAMPMATLRSSASRQTDVSSVAEAVAQLGAAARAKAFASRQAPMLSGLTNRPGLSW